MPRSEGEWKQSKGGHSRQYWDSNRLLLVHKCRPIMTVSTSFLSRHCKIGQKKGFATSRLQMRTLLTFKSISDVAKKLGLYAGMRPPTCCPPPVPNATRSPHSTLWPPSSITRPHKRGRMDKVDRGPTPFLSSLS